MLFEIKPPLWQSCWGSTQKIQSKEIEIVHVLFNKEWLGYYRQRQCVFSLTNSDFW